MAFYANDVHPIPPDHGAEHCDDQLPLISRVGRGLQGDAWRVKLDEDRDSCTETYVEGGYIDGADKTWHTEWISKNINGGELKYQYNLRPGTIPRTFTITFIYKRPGRHEWSWTTPAIPYIWSVDDNGFVEDPDSIVGSGVATLFIRTGKNKPWNERLNYPIDPDTGEPYPRTDFNAPLPDQAWASTITFGIGGDIDIPNVDDIAKILGVEPDDIYDIIDDKTINIDGIDVDNIVDFIKKADARVLDHVHKDLGFPNGTLAGDGGSNSIKKYVDGMVDNIEIISPNITVKKTKHTHTIGDSDSYGVDFELTAPDIVGGAGISVDKKGDTYTITNTQVGGTWTTLTAGQDFDFTWHNGWVRDVPVSGAIPPFSGHPIDKNKPPIVRIIPSKNTKGEIVGAEVKISVPTKDEALINTGDLLDDNNFKLKHSDDVWDCPQSAIVSIEFKNSSNVEGGADYTPLNNKSVKTTISSGSNIWNVQGTNSDIHSSNDWHTCGASWMVNCSCTKNIIDDEDNPKYGQKAITGAKEFIMVALNISNGYNSYKSPNYGYSHLCTRPITNFSWQFTL